MERFDAIVVGGGPAGAAAARVLAEGGARVVLLEKQSYPRVKVCGGGLLPRALATLPTGFALPVERTCPSATLDLGIGGRRFEVNRGSPVVTMTMRAAFDAALAQAAASAGAVVRDGQPVRGATHDGGLWRVAVDHDTVVAPLVVGADGATGVVGRAAGFAPLPLTIPALEAEVEVAAPGAGVANSARFVLGVPRDGYAWIFPKATHLSVGVLTMSSRPVNLHALLREFLDHAGIRVTRWLSERGAPIPIRVRPGGCARDGVLLTGDAAGLVDPVTAEGIGNALLSGALAARAALEAAGDPETACARYGTALKTGILDDLIIARLPANVLYFHPHLSAFLFARAGQPVCNGVARVALGPRTWRQSLLNPAGWGRLARRVVTGSYRSPRV